MFKKIRIKKLSKEKESNAFAKKAKEMRWRVRLLSLLFLLALSGILFVRVMNLSQTEPTMKEIVQAEKSKISGDIKDRNGEVIAEGTGTNGLMKVKKVHLDSLLGIPVGHSKSTFYLRTVLGKDLYGIASPLSSLVGSGLTSTRAKGNTVTLTVDSGLNKDIYEMFSESPVDAGVAIVYNYKTGEVIANVSYPDYNISGRRYKNLLGDNGLVSKTAKNSGAVNRCTQETYMPASSIKPILYASIFTLDASLIDFSCNCPGYWTNSNGTHITDHGHSKVTVKNATAYSCNIFAEKLSQKVTTKELNQFLRKKLEMNGKTKKTAEGLSYYSGRLNMKDKDQKAMSVIGEGNANVSPLMLARMYGAILNQGVMLEPVYTLSTEGKSQKVFSKKACKAVLKGMRTAVTSSKGTCHIFKDLDLGDATLYAKSGTGDDSNRTSWCVSAVKNSNKPYVVLTGVFRCTSDNATKNAKELNKKILKKIY